MTEHLEAMRLSALQAMLAELDLDLADLQEVENEAFRCVHGLLQEQ